MEYSCAPSWSGGRAVKLILQVAFGVILGVAIIAGAVYTYRWYTTRSTATKAERDAAADFIDLVVRTCSLTNLSTDTCTQQIFDACKNFHLNQPDCSALMSRALGALKQQLKSCEDTVRQAHLSHKDCVMSVLSRKAN